jgi:beta-lactamase regulating signal transducer with metallopeptidase domain
MNGYIVLDTLLWVGITGLLLVLIALAACRVESLHPAVKTWICRITFIKVTFSLALSASMPMVRDQAWLTAELMWFLLTIWAAGVVVVATYGVRAYRAAAQLKSRAHRVNLGSVSDMEVRELSGLPEPCVVGVIRPVLLVPSGPPADDAVIHHELAHVKHLDAPFGALTWIVQAIFWFIPGYGRLIAEHSLWQEVWADLASRKQLELAPSYQANALLSAVSKIRETPVAALGYRGDAKVVARRIEAMFVGRYSRAFGLLAITLACVAAIPIEIDASGRPAPDFPSRAARAKEQPAFAPIATRQNVP